MKNRKIQIPDLDFEYKLWKNRLALFSHEIEYFFERVKVIKKENPLFNLGKEKKSKLREHQKSILHIKNRIFTLEQEIAFYAEDYPISDNHLHFINHEIIRGGMMEIISQHEKLMTEVYPNLCTPLLVKEREKQEL